MVTKTRIVTSNYWHNPGIKTTVFHDATDAPKGAISLEIDMTDFIKALAAEFAHPLKIWTRGGLTTAIQDAVTSVIEKKKEASTEAIMALR